jgi:predicted amidohydrolase/5'(3')-deoxyribonucleotidase
MNFCKSLAFRWFSRARFPTSSSLRLKNPFILRTFQLAMATKEIIAVDIDEVLAFFMPNLVNFHNAAYSTEFTVDSFRSYDFHKIWGGTIADANVKMDEFFESTHFKDNMIPIPHALEALNELKKDYDLHIVTARLNKLEDITRAWIGKHYPNIFHEIHFGNHYASSGKSRSKPEMCKAINAKLLIDDSLTYATQCIREGIKVILFGNYAWNQVPDTDFEKEATHLNRVHTFNDARIIDYPGSGDINLHHPENEKTAFRVLNWETVKNLVYQLVPVAREGTSSTVSTSSTTMQQEHPHHLPSEMNHEKLNVFALQMCSVNNKEANQKKIESLIRDIASKHFTNNQEDPSSSLITNLICLPECALFMGTTSDETVAQAEILLDSTGVTYDLSEEKPSGVPMYSSDALVFLSQLAQEYQIWLSVGSFPEKSTENPEKMFNTHFMINPRGEIDASSIYRKIHLFDCPLVGLQESRLTGLSLLQCFFFFFFFKICFSFFLKTDAGNEIKSIDINGWKIGLTICYDLRFPPLYQRLREQEKVDCVLVPAAFTIPTGTAHWEILLRARAIENQMYVIAPAQSGKHNEKRESYGHSMIVDPWGSIGK